MIGSDQQRKKILQTLNELHRTFKQNPQIGFANKEPVN